MCVTIRLAVCASLLLTTQSGRAEDEKVPVKELPKAVTASIKAKFRKAELKEATKQKDDDETSYEVSIAVGTSKFSWT